MKQSIYTYCTHIQVHVHVLQSANKIPYTQSLSLTYYSRLRTRLTCIPCTYMHSMYIHAHTSQSTCCTIKWAHIQKGVGLCLYQARGSDQASSTLVTFRVMLSLSAEIVMVQCTERVQARHCNGWQGSRLIAMVG